MAGPLGKLDPQEFQDLLAILESRALRALREELARQVQQEVERQVIKVLQDLRDQLAPPDQE